MNDVYKNCFHRDLHNVIIRDKIDNSKRGCVFVHCRLCGLKGPTVKIGIMRWWAIAKATSGFYRLANHMDDTDDNPSRGKE